MTNYSVIERGAREVLKYQDAHYRTSMTWDEAYKLVQDWYDHTDITSAYLLSACVLAFGAYKPVTFSQIMEASKQFEK